jgi:RimJ/RimL family protein N-acetyltransferase
MIGLRACESSRLNTWITRKALKAMLCYFFGKKGTVEVTVEVVPGHVRSVKILGKIEFMRSGVKKRVWEVEGEWKGSIGLVVRV